MIMKYLNDDKYLVQKHGSLLSGVLLFSDLAVLFAEPHKTALYRRIRLLLQDGTLTQFKKGVYTTGSFDPDVLSQKICPQSYVSFGSVLAASLVIGVVPKLQVDAVKLGKTRLYDSPTLRVRHLGCASHLFFGYDTVHGVNKAQPEKALLDTFYFHQHGTKFPFDLYSDISWERLNKDRLAEYLLKYRNAKFIKFFTGVLNAAA